jgi:methylenetetrahydrofolate reductase (NADPH)
MDFCDKLAAGVPTLSYEFSPPKNPAEWARLYSTLGEITRQAPDFVSVTYGAGGSNRQKTVDLVSRIERELDIESVPHLTCLGHSQEEISEILTTLQAAGIRHLMALRGDAPKNDALYQPHPGGFAHASDLIKYAEANFDFHIGCAFYPEKHPDAERLDDDIQWLKFKQDCGAEFATSQLFFDNAVYYEFRDQAAKAGVTIPLIAGILPVTSLSQLARIGELSGQDIPQKLLDALGEGTDKEIQERGIDYATIQCRDLLQNSAPGVHLYTFNRAASAVKITKTLRAEGWFPVAPKGK